MLKILMSLLLFTSLSANALGHQKSSLVLDQTVHDTGKLDFQSHVGPGAWDNYLVMDLPFLPVANLFKQLLVKRRQQMTNRGEAHITVLTPIEYTQALSSVLTMDDINELAELENIQQSQFKVLCLGRGRVTIDEKVEDTYFVVVKSDELIELRQKIQHLFVAKGGDKSAFTPDNFFPHITVGFTKRDLHESDGVQKDVEACHYLLKH